MNIFKQYGIKEVADVVFYSITRIGEEEFYVPVLYFDTLKVTSLDKNVTAVPASGGKGNGKILSWNFGKDLKLKLEDALFSQMSLNTFMNGRVMAKMSPWTSAIAKLNVANKYGQKHYSTKAFPSPELTEAEWEIVYRCAQKAGFDPRTGYSDKIAYNRLDGYNNHTSKYMYDSEGQDVAIDAMVAENRWLLKDAYYRRKQKTPHSRNIAPYFDYNANDYEGVSIVIQDVSLAQELEEAKEVAALKNGERWGGWRDVTVTFKKKEEDNITRKESLETHDASYDIVIQINFSLEKTPSGFKCVWCYISADNMTLRSDTPSGEMHTVTPTIDILKSIFTGYNKDSTQDGGFNPTFHIGNEFFLSHILYYIFPHYLEDAIGDLCWCDMQDKIYTAMPQEVINFIAEEIDEFSKTGHFENDLYEAQVIDRFEKCVVNKKEGLAIDLIEQMQNVKKLYRNDQSNFTVFYDAKTMLPFMMEKILDEKILAQKCVRVYKKGSLTEEDYLTAVKSYLENQYDADWVENLTSSDFVINKVTDQYGNYPEDSKLFKIVKEGNNVVHVGQESMVTDYEEKENCYLVYFSVVKRDFINLKQGTVYYKRSRTIDEDVNDITFIGTDLSIDVDTFPGEFLIVGETYIREQQTGKDRRLQLIINRAAISASTKIQLQAAGNPSTFSIDVDVLVPKSDKKSMIELRQYDVEEDKLEGGFKIVPQNKRHVYTPTIQVREEIVGKNIEIY